MRGGTERRESSIIRCFAMALLVQNVAVANWVTRRVRAHTHIRHQERTLYARAQCNRNRQGEREDERVADARAQHSAASAHITKAAIGRREQL